MIYPDYHLHTEFSSDCTTPIRDLITSARAKGLTEICITDHHDEDFPKDTGSPHEFQLDFERYFSALSALQEELSPKFTLRIGIEQGLMPSTCEKMSNFSGKYPCLDFIICSTHVVDGFDPYYPDYFEKWGEKNGYRKYFEDILHIVTHFTDYNVYGHLDYILRYGPTKADHFNVHDYMELFEAIFRSIIENGKGIELNTGSLYRGMDFAHPHPELLKLYKEMGGEIITFGSDAHDTVHVGHAFSEGAELLLSLGYKYYCTFDKMQPAFHSL